MKLSIIIPMYNCEPFIERCLDSILNQNIPQESYEVLVINDGSTDNSLYLAREFGSKFSNFTVIDQSNKGQSAARNLGISKAEGDFIWFIDADDYIAHNVFKPLLEIQEKHDLDILRFRIVKTDNLGLLECRNIETVDTEIKVTDGSTHIAENNYHEGPCGYIIKSKFLKDSGIKFVEGRIMEDMIFTAELFLHANKMAYYPLDVYRYFFNPSSTWNNLNSAHNRKAAEDFQFMAEKFSALISTLDPEKQTQTIARLKRKRDFIVTNIGKRILQADFTISEVVEIFNALQRKHLIPIENRSNDFKKRYLIKSLTNKHLFLLDFVVFRLFRNNLNFFINTKLRKKHLKKYDLPL